MITEDTQLIIGLDLSLTSTGVSIYSISDDTIVTESIKTSNKNSYMQRYRIILDRITEIDHFIVPAAIYFIEGYSFGSFGKSSSMSNLIELGGIIKYDLTNRERFYIDVPPTVLKKFVTGKGNAKKEDIKLALYKKYHKEFKNSDEADAYALTMFGLKYLEIGSKLTTIATTSEKECILKVRGLHGPKA
jgi:crossover junction endodeoxyribonuclease RuvC